MEGRAIKERLSKSSVSFGEAAEVTRPRMRQKIMSIGVTQYVMDEPMVAKIKDVSASEYGLKVATRESLLPSMETQYKEADEKRERARMEEALHPFEYDMKQRVVPLRDRLRTPAAQVSGFVHKLSGKEPLPRDEAGAKKLAMHTARVDELRRDEETKKAADAVLADDVAFYAGRKKFDRGDVKTMDIDPKQNKFGSAEEDLQKQIREASVRCKEWNQASIGAKSGGGSSLFAARARKKHVEGGRSLEGAPLRIGAKTPQVGERHKQQEEFRAVLDSDQGRYGVLDRNDGVPEWWDPDMHSPRKAAVPPVAMVSEGDGSLAMYETSSRALNRVKTGVRIEPTGWTGLQVGEELNGPKNDEKEAARARYADALERQKAQHGQRKDMARAKSRATNLQMLEKTPPYVDHTQWPARQAEGPDSRLGQRATEAVTATQPW